MMMGTPQKRFTVEIIEFDDEDTSQSRPQPSSTTQHCPPIMENLSILDMNEIEEYSDEEYSITRSQEYSRSQEPSRSLQPEPVLLQRKITDYGENSKNLDDMYLLDRLKSSDPTTPKRQNFKDDIKDIENEREDTFNPSMFKIDEDDEDDEDYDDFDWNIKPFPKITQVTVSPNSKNEKEMSFEQIQQDRLFRTLSLPGKNMEYDVEYSRSISSDFSMTEFELMQRAFAKMNGTYVEKDERQNEEQKEQEQNNENSITFKVDIRKANFSSDPDDELNQRIKQLNDRLTDSLTVTPQNGSRDVSPDPDEQLDLTLL